uniref:Putative ixodes 10 kDa peptide protein n=1 Tax=Ixodes ricinus TaxID=34613 RepID=A0A0K8R695_IXORI
MLFVLFAMVLILPAFQGERFVSAASSCFGVLLKGGGEIYCQLSGYRRFNAWYGYTCELGCDGGAMKVRLPESVCPRGKMMYPCTKEDQHTLERFSADMRNKKSHLTKIWCNKA